MIRRAALLAVPLAVAAGAAGAQTHTLPIRNGSGETVTGVYMSAPGSGSPGANRLLSTLPPGAEGGFSYSHGCRADVRIVYITGRTEDHPDVDVCGGARVVAGQDGVAGPPMAPGKPRAAAPSRTAPRPEASTAAVAPPPVVPPWTGKSITKRFGGME